MLTSCKCFLGAPAKFRKFLGKILQSNNYSPWSFLLVCCKIPIEIFQNLTRSLNIPLFSPCNNPAVLKTLRNITYIFQILIFLYILYFMYFMIIFFFQLQPEDTEKYIDYLINIGWLDEAALKLAEIIDNVQYFQISCYSFYLKLFYLDKSYKYCTFCLLVSYIGFYCFVCLCIKTLKLQTFFFKIIFYIQNDI